MIETGAYDQPATDPSYLGFGGMANWFGYYISQSAQVRGWEDLMNYIKTKLAAPQGSNLVNHLGGIPLRTYPWPNGPLLKGYYDYFGDFTQYILNNVCQSTSCN